MIAFIILEMLAAFPSIGSITGDGFSWQSFSTYSVAAKGTKAIQNGDPAQIEKAISFTEISGSDSATEMAENIDRLRGNGIQILEADTDLFSSKQEDRFPQTTITLSVRNGEDEYQIVCLSTVDSSKLMMIRFDTVWHGQSNEPLMKSQIPEWIDELEAILCTYSPG